MPEKEVRLQGLTIPEIEGGLTMFDSTFHEISKTELNAHLLPNNSSGMD